MSAVIAGRPNEATKHPESVQATWRGVGAGRDQLNPTVFAVPVTRMPPSAVLLCVASMPRPPFPMTVPEPPIDLAAIGDAAGKDRNWPDENGGAIARGNQAAIFYN